MTPEEIRQVYNAGPEAVITLVTRLLDIISTLSEQIAQLQQQNQQLTARVQTLESQVAKNSHNSSKPPASDGLKKPAPKSLRLQSGKRPGGQPGHPGTTLCWSQTPDQIIEHQPEHCAACGQGLTFADTVSVERRQVHDLPVLRLLITEHWVHTCRCPACQQQTKADFQKQTFLPASRLRFSTALRSRHQYGAQVKALAVYLNCYQLLPFARSAQILHDLLGISFSSGTLSTVQQQCSQQLEPVTQQIKAALTQAKLVHFDETGARIVGRLHWLYVAATPQLTFYSVHAKRGRAATDEIGILPAFGGRAIHDGWPTYLTYGCSMTYGCSHGLCNAHHLRELTFLAEEGGFLWAQAMKRLLQEMKVAVDQAKAQGPDRLSALVRSAFEKRYTRLLAQARTAHPPALPALGKKGTRKRGRVKQSAGYNLAERLRLSRSAVLAFVHDFGVPFDNNLAERDIRMMKLRLKISGGFRTQAGADIFCRIRGYLSTMLKQGHHALHVLTALLNGQVLCPMLCT